MIDLAEIRRATGMTQVQLAEALATTQGQVSRFERQGDMLLSSLADYLQATGATATITVSVGHHTFTYDLTKGARGR